MEIHSIGSPGLWAGFIAFVLAMLALDLGVFHRKAHVVKVREAAVWSAIWVGISLLFNLGVLWRFGAQPATEFLTGYLIEKSLSVDNIFIFVVIFGAMKIPAIYQHRVLFWGILSALVLRAAMIFAGVALLERFHWLIYVFGAFLVVTGVKLYRDWRKGAEAHPEESRVLGMIRRVLPSTTQLHGPHFFAREGGRWLATPLFMALLLVELTDVVFALDSIPAIFAVTRDPFIVFTSNIFAILGLRSLFFLLAGMVDRFHYLKVGLAGILAFVGLKMALVDVVHVHPFVSLAVIAAMLVASILASFSYAKRHPGAAASAPAEREAREVAAHRGQPVEEA
ncbi:TerC family protein [Aggregicoccus sp. 17bor-14]|uniref:TerC family protein n=1 Tax=Myxococcaceae TaxID=31 RepID=UPI00129CE8F4|nr:MULTISPECIES: TerC family protein [Myxococcaceae]MBF5044285.1 TerC family protein [Simulacricoccus sp. 17bor-14]MRI90035.1 TerC family protein [Aggregicoccus sp. 17bor-14]